MGEGFLPEQLAHNDIPLDFARPLVNLEHLHVAHQFLDELVQKVIEPAEAKVNELRPNIN
jgi:hypothetical protein